MLEKIGEFDVVSGAVRVTDPVMTWTSGVPAACWQPTAVGRRWLSAARIGCGVIASPAWLWSMSSMLVLPVTRSWTSR